MQERDIFIEALQRLDPTERSSYLNKACAADDALRGRVLQLLAEHEKPESFLLDAPPFGAGAATIDEPIAERPGTVIGPYKLLEQIGEGGFGIVFMAEQQSPIRRKVALKVIKPGMDTRQVIARFEAERQALALMDHPNIAKVLEAGTIGTEPRTPVTGSDHPPTNVRGAGHPYFVMELVKGLPITDYCDQNQLPPRERLELFVNVCQAVQHAHQKGIIHRDLKPTNVLVTLQDGAALVKVIDFGIAKAMGQQLTDKTLFTNFAQLIGTPLYMAPEQAALSNIDVDTRSDIYSLGVLLYELLTGTTPFDKDRFKEAGYDEMRRIIREEEPPKPSTRISTLGQAAKTVSTQRKSDAKHLSQLFRGELDWIVMKALEKDRNRRYVTALDLAADIERHLQHEPVLACPPTWRYRLRKFVRRRGGLVAAVAAVLVVLVGGIATTTVGYLQARESERQARDAEAEARATVDFLTFDFLALDPQGGTGGQNVTIREALDAAAPKIDQATAQQPRVEAAICHVVGATYRFLGEHEKAAPYLERAVAIRTRVLGEEDPGTLTSLHHLGHVLYARGQLAGAEAMCRTVLAGRRKHLLGGHADIASSLAFLGLILTDQGKPDEAEPLLREALVSFGAALSGDHWRTANARSLLGGCLSAQGRYTDAEPLLLTGYQTLQTAHGAPPEHKRLALGRIIRLYDAWEKKDKAEEWRKKRPGLNASDKVQSETAP